MSRQCPACDRSSSVEYRCEHCGKDLVDTGREVQPMSNNEPGLEELASRLDEMEARMDALNRNRLYLQERVDELEDENQKLRDQLASLQDVVNPDPSSRDYESLTRDQKVHRLRRTLVEQAARSSTGKARMEYTDVKWLFDGNPSPGHAYDLMQLAGELDGFNYENPDGDRQIRITANLDAVNDESLVHAANKASSEVGGP